MFERLEFTKRPVKRTVSSDGVPVYEFGYASVYEAPPELNDEHEVQKGNNTGAQKITLKKSWEIESNYIGACTTRMPQIPENIELLNQPINLIDGNIHTCYSSKSHVRPNHEKVWIRLDFSMQRNIERVVIKKRPIIYDRYAQVGSYVPVPGAHEVGRAMAKHISIKTSCDAMNWNEVINERVDAEGEESFEFSFEKSPCKQLLLTVADFTACENLGYAFSVAAIEVYDIKGNNIALVSKGTTVTTNSSNAFMADTEANWWYWPLHFDLGMKWSRIGYHNDPINWHWVEREKGKLWMDPEAEKAIDMLTDNGVNIVYCLNFGNRLYEGDPARNVPQLPEWYYETPFPPKCDEALLGWDNFVRFSVNYFKDRVKYFEIWNEWNGTGYWGDTPDVNHYIKLAKRSIKIIREIAPEVKIVMGSFAQFVHEQIPENCDENISMFYTAIKELAPLVDVIGFHPFYQPSMDSDRYLDYPENVKRFKKYCEDCGFKHDRYMASEYAVGAMYPPTLPDGPACWWGMRGRVNYSEIEKAKVIAQLITRHSGMGIESMYCELSSPNYPLELSLLKKGFDSYPIQTMNPNAAYYVIRNMCTVFDGLEPAEIKAEISEETEWYGFSGKDRKCIALFKTGSVCDECDGVETDIVFDEEFSQAFAINLMNGEKTKLNIRENGKEIKGIIVRDVPLLIEIK